MIQTFHSSNFLSKEQLYAIKKQKETSISVVIPALNEAATIGTIVSRIFQGLNESYPIIDEVVVMDGFSEDGTVVEACKAGAKVYNVDSVIPQVRAKGKGVALWKSQFVTSGDIIVFIDSDILDFDERFICGLIGPLLLHDGYDFVKAFYKRPLLLGSGVYENHGGRVTEIMVRPLLSSLLPDLSYFYQPLAGEYAIRRSLMELLPVFSGYGVEIGLLIDIYFLQGLSKVAQVDMEKRWHRNRTVLELGKMSFSILQVIMSRMQKFKLINIPHLYKQMPSLDDFSPATVEYEEFELPPKVEFSEDYTYGY